MKILMTLGLLSSIFCVQGYELTHSEKEVSPTERTITLSFDLPANEHIYADSIIPSVSNPSVKLSELKSSTQPVTFFDETYKKEKEGYTGKVTFSTTATLSPTAPSTEAAFHVHFFVSSDTKPQEKSIPLTFVLPAPSTVAPSELPTVTKKPFTLEPVECEPTPPSLVGNLVNKLLNYISVTIFEARAALVSLFETTGSKTIRLLAALILGILLSLTPCIYPMIPITIGILQANGSRSRYKNFLLALCYTLGISVTFALLGLIAAVGSCVFGELQGSPFFIIPLALVLACVGLTMFDFFQLPIPQWLQPKASVKGGSFKSAFVFGVLSGTVASPCLSPGILLILNYVANITAQSITAYIEGFLLLFVFGVGSSLPLLIIGTFSGSLALLPKAGAWMVEIKKIVGIMLISMALYHLSHLERLLPWYIFVWIVALTFVALGIYYFISIKKHDSRGMHWYKNIMGTFLIIIGCIIASSGQRAFIEHLFPEEKKQLWQHDYQQAFDNAIAEQKLLFIDVGATYCAICKALDEQIFQQQRIQDALTHFSILKIDADVHTNAYETIKQQWGPEITGYPTYLIVEPTTLRVIRKWSIDIDQMSLEGIENEFKKVAQEYADSLKPKGV